MGWADYNLLWSGSPYSHIVEVMSLSSILLQAFELVYYERRQVKLKHSLALEQLYRSWSHDAIVCLAKPEKAQDLTSACCHLHENVLPWNPMKQLVQGRLTRGRKARQKQALWGWAGSLCITCHCGIIPVLALTVYLQLGKPLIPKGLCLRQPLQNKHKLPPIVSCRQLQLLPTCIQIFPCQTMQ